MTAFNHGAFMRELRKRQGKIPTALYNNIMQALDYGFGAEPVQPKGDEPAWLVEARKHVGLREIRGSKHNPKILQWVRHLGGWFTDDETPWCGTFVGYCMAQAGHTVPKHWYRARAWAEWGVSTPDRVGAVAVFARRGGGHVGFVVGESATNLYILGGNQSNMVNIAPIAKSRLLDLRWPEGEPLSQVRLARMSGGAISRNAA